MWLLKLLPVDFSLYLVHLLLLISVIGIVIGFVSSQLPLLSRYGNIIKLVAIVLFGYSIYLEGGMQTEKEWKMKVAALEEKVKVAESESKKVVTVIQEKVVEKVKYVQGKTKTIVKKVPVYITREVDRQYPVPESFVVLHDAAAGATEVPVGAEDFTGRTSEVKISEVAATVADNYGTCNEIREKLIGWQEWYKKQKEIYDRVK